MCDPRTCEAWIKALSLCVRQWNNPAPPNTFSATVYLLEKWYFCKSRVYWIDKCVWMQVLQKTQWFHFLTLSHYWCLTFTSFIKPGWQKKKMLSVSGPEFNLVQMSVKTRYHILKGSLYMFLYKIWFKIPSGIIQSVWWCRQRSDILSSSSFNKQINWKLASFLGLVSCVCVCITSKRCQFLFFFLLCACGDIFERVVEKRYKFVPFSMNWGKDSVCLIKMYSIPLLRMI